MKVKIYGKYEPYKWQKDAHEIISKWLEHPNKVARTLVIKASRQKYGKSAFVKAELLRVSLLIPMSVNSYVSPDLGLSRKMFKEIKRGAKDLIQNANGTILEIELINGSIIKFHSEAQGEGLRGYTTTGVLIVDEGSSFKDTTFYELIKPWTTVHKALTIIVSTPKAETGFFFDSYNLGLGVNPYYKTLDWVEGYGHLCPISPEDLAIKDSVPSMKWETEYEGRFMKAKSAVFGDFSRCLLSMPDKEFEKLYIGLDFGGGNGGDYTVLTAFNEKKRMQFTWSTNNLSPTKQIDEISRLLQPYLDKIERITAESNSIGTVYIDMLKGKGFNISKFNTSNDSKRKLVEQTQVAIANRDIFLLNEPQIISQLALFERKVSNGTITYAASSGHDDFVVSLMIAYNSIINSNSFYYKLI